MSDFKERFLNFDTFEGAFIILPWGLINVYLALTAPEFLWTFNGLAFGSAQIVWALRKILVNPIKKQVKERKLVKAREALNVD